MPALSPQEPRSLSWRLKESAGVGDVDKVNEEIAKGIDVNDGGEGRRTALHRACGRGRTEVVRALLAAGATPDAQTAGTHDSGLHMAAGGGFVDIVVLLLQHGASVSLANGCGWTPLHAALHANQMDVARILTRAGADPAKCNQAGVSPMMLSLRCDQHQVDSIAESARFQKENELDVAEGTPPDKPNYNQLRMERVQAASEREAARKTARDTAREEMKERSLVRKTAQAERSASLRFALETTIQASSSVLHSGTDYHDVTDADCALMGAMDSPGRRAVGIIGSPTNRRPKSNQERKRDRAVALKKSMQAASAKERAQRILQSRMGTEELEKIRLREEAKLEEERKVAEAAIKKEQEIAAAAAAAAEAAAEAAAAATKKEAQDKQEAEAAEAAAKQEAEAAEAKQAIEPEPELELITEATSHETEATAEATPAEPMPVAEVASTAVAEPIPERGAEQESDPAEQVPTCHS